MPIINPGLRFIVRSPSTVQVGIGAGGLLLEGLTGNDVAFLRALQAGVPEDDVAGAAEHCGLSPARARLLQHTLGAALFSDGQARLAGLRGDRLRADAESLAAVHRKPVLDLLYRRGHAVVRVIGLGRTGAALAQALATSGVGTLLLEDDRTVTAADTAPAAYAAADIGLPRSTAVRRHLQAIDPGTVVHPVRTPAPGQRDVATPDLSIFTGHDAIAPDIEARLMRTDMPHLFVLNREQDGTVGPLVVPGVTACGGCLQRHRGAGDRQWFALAGEVAASAAGAGRSAPECPAMALALAGTAAAQVLLFLDAVNRPAAWSAVLTLASADGRWTRAQVPVHPECGCQLQNQAVARISSTASP